MTKGLLVCVSVAVCPSVALSDTSMCASGGVESFSVYRVHGREPSSLKNRNVGDSNGEIEMIQAYFCQSPPTSSNWVTKWAVEASADWATYQKCHFVHSSGKDECTPSDSQPRSGSSKHMGCRALDDVNGTWYSLPEDGECAPGTAVGTNGCTWKARPIRTISLDCLYNDRKGMICAPPLQFPQAVEALDAAFATSDPAQGGCPHSAPDALAVGAGKHLRGVGNAICKQEVPLPDFVLPPLDNKSAPCGAAFEQAWNASAACIKAAQKAVNNCEVKAADYYSKICSCNQVNATQLMSKCTDGSDAVQESVDIVETDFRFFCEAGKVV